MTESLTQADRRELLETLIAENPAAVADFLDRLDMVNGLLDAVAVGTAGLDDEMLQHLTATGATLAEAADEMATDETVALARAVGENGDGLGRALETMVRLENDGTLDDLSALADTIALMSAALDDEMVVKLARTGSSLGEVVDTAADPETVRALNTLLSSVGEAGAEEPARVGMLGMARAMRDPDVQTGLGFILGIARATGRELREGDL